MRSIKAKEFIDDLPIPTKQYRELVKHAVELAEAEMRDQALDAYRNSCCERKGNNLICNLYNDIVSIELCNHCIRINDFIKSFDNPKTE